MPTTIRSTDTRVQVIEYTLIVLYGLIYVLCMAHLLRAWIARCYSHWDKDSEVRLTSLIIQIFLVICAVQSLMRLSYLVYVAIQSFYPTIEVLPFFELLWGQIPGVMFFSMFSVLVVNWAQIYHFNRALRRIVMAFGVAANLCLYAVFMFSLALYFIPGVSERVALMTNYLSLAVFSFAMAGCIIGYGALIYMKYRAIQPTLESSATLATVRASRLLLSVSFITTFAFIMRGLLLSLSIIVFALKLSPFLLWIDVFFYYFGSEILPIFVILLLFAAFYLTPDTYSSGSLATVSVAGLSYGAVANTPMRLSTPTNYALHSDSGSSRPRTSALPIGAWSDAEAVAGLHPEFVLTPSSLDSDDERESKLFLKH